MTTPRRIVCSTLAVGILALLACVSGGCAKTLQTISMKIGSGTYVIELAMTMAEKERGLMYRDSMPANHGMLFVYDADQEMRYWMKNTRIPLSIAFIGSDGVIMDLFDMEPFDLTGVETRYKVRYALELNRGEFGRAGVGVGSRLELPPLPEVPK